MNPSDDPGRPRADRDSLMRSVLYFSLPLSIALVVSAALLGGGNLLRAFDGRHLDDESYQQVKLITDSLTLLEDQYVEELDMWQVVFEGLSAMAHRDTYSNFYEPVRAKRFNEETNREYFGVGFSTLPQRRPLVIDYLFEDSPAEKAGLLPGDTVIAVDGNNVEELDSNETIQAIKGPLGTKVTLTIRRADREDFDVTLPRARIQQPTVTTGHYEDPDGKVHYLHIEGFGEHTAEEFDKHLKRIQEAGAEALILDLRENQGGLVGQCEQVANRFLDEGKIVKIVQRNTPDKVTVADPDECWLPDLPLVVLVNENTASAAEIVAGALQDHKRALLVGARTYGKGVVQSIYEVEVDEEHGKATLKITTGEYLTPADRHIDRFIKRQTPVRGGLEPDVRIDMDEKTLETLANRYFMLSISPKYREAFLQARQREMPELEDRQLEAALKVLRGETVAQDS